MKQSAVRWLTLAVVTWLNATCSFGQEPTAEQRAFFEARIQPVLVKHCYSCHSLEAARSNKLKAGLLLDSREGIGKGGESGAVLVAGKPGESLLISAIRHDGLEMPPAGKLPEEVIADFVKWVEQGAPDPRKAASSMNATLAEKAKSHWAFRAPIKPSVPDVRDSNWPATELDRFILVKLEQEGLRPSSEADRVTLLRRLCLDLTGLPPTIAEIEAFLADTSTAAYERQVERLLRSPHYGERWGRHWLDAARYADSDGYEKDKPRQVWMYRDWVVKALNRDLPYDQFIIQQLAGDLLPNPTQDQIVATGFLRNSMINEEGGVDPEQFRMDAMFDRMDAIGRSVLGLAINCCQCHDHKYDPLTQEDYYRLFAYINDTHEAHIAVYTPDEQQRRAELFRQIHELETDLQHRTPDWTERMAKWEESARGGQPEWKVLPVKNAGDNSQRYLYHADGSQTAWGYAPTKWSSQFRGQTDQTNITAIRLELLTDPELPLGGPGRSPIGLCALSELIVEVADPAAPEKKEKIKLASATADFANAERELEPRYDDKTGKKRTTGPVGFAIDGKDETAWGIDAGPGRRNVGRQAVFVLEKPISLAGGAVLSFQIKQMHGGWNSDDNQNNNLGRFRFSVTSFPSPAADPIPHPVRDLLAIPAAQRSPAQQQAVFSIWRRTVAEWKDVHEQVEALWQQHPVGTSQLTFQSRETARQSFILRRGDFLKPGKPVQAGVPSVLHPLAEDSDSNRLTLARWLVDRQSPTTARAIVNRVWQTYFGTGFVSSSEDLGTQCEPPSHPELFDWLATEFMDHGWSLKNLHRLIVLSATYRQSSRATPELLAKDPNNRLLARASRLRVEGEVVRDIALAASGLLSPKLGGPSVYPPAPDFLFVPPASYGPKVWREEQGEDRYRRALYTFRFRSVPYPVLTAFDAPNGDASCVRRVRSNTPLQALATLNETLFLESARSLAIQTLHEGGVTDADRLAHAFQRCVARRPGNQEQRVLMELLEKEHRKFSAAEAKPWEFAANDRANPPSLPPGATAAQAAAWTAVCRVILNLDETITKE